MYIGFPYHFAIQDTAEKHFKMTTLYFLMLILAICTVGSVQSRTSDHGDILLGLTETQANPLDTAIDMKRPSSLLKIHKNGYFSSENVTSLRKLLRLLETTPSTDDLPCSGPHITTFKISALVRDAHHLSYFKKVRNTELERKIGNFVQNRYDKVFDPKLVLLSVWNQYDSSESIQDATQDVYKFQCVVASNGSASYAIFINDGPKFCKDGKGEQTHNEKEVGGKPGMTNNLPTGDLTESRKAEQVADVPSEQDFYQLMSKDGKCLMLDVEDGAMSECTDDKGEVASSTVFRITGAPGNEQVELFGTGKCLDREHCHSTTSNLRLSDCDHCGAIHWDVKSDGTLREDEGKNCVYVVESTQKAMIHHSDEGCTVFNFSSLGNSVLMKSINFGDCLAGGIFEECHNAPRFFVNGLSRRYQFQDTQSRECIDREHCHSSRSNMRLFSCDHCGAIHWSIEDTEIGEDEMKNCVNREGKSTAFVKHCTDSWEKMAFEIVPSNTSFTLKMRSDRKKFRIPDPVVQDYIDALQSSRIRGVRLFRDDRNGNAVLEIIHSVPREQVFQVTSQVGNFQMKFWVARINTFIPFTNDLTPQAILTELMKNEGSIQEFNLRYGAVDSSNRVFEEEDGLVSLFVTNTIDDLPEQVPRDASFLKGIVKALDLHRWWHRPPNFHYQSYKQSYYTFSFKKFYRAIYWSNK